MPRTVKSETKIGVRHAKLKPSIMSRVRLFGLSALIAPGIRIIKIVSSTIKFPTVATKKQRFGIDPRNQHATERGSEEHRSVKNHLIKSDSVWEIGTRHQMMQNRLAHRLFKGDEKAGQRGNR
jgi:hypothetical protein